MTKEEELDKYIKENPDIPFKYAVQHIYNVKLRVSKGLPISVQKWQRNNPEKIKAHRMVYVAVRNGTLKKKNCKCGSNKVQAHHEDYSKPLKVKWLCKKHHVIADQKRRILDKNRRSSVMLKDLALT